ncbi:MAG: hypothetical protein Q9227_000084 [Pyrenula ochraceoflavens]
MSSPSLPIVAFYRNADPLPDYKGRELAQILSYNDFQLEMDHSYIQVLFPLPEPSDFNFNATIVDLPTARAFRDPQNSDLRDNLRKALRRMLAFYGFEFDADGSIPRIIPASNSRERFNFWARRFNHNHLRITRIIRSLRTLGLEAEAMAFLEALKVATEGRFEKQSMVFWRRAAERALQYKPEDGDEGLATGPRWLREL